MSAQLLTIADIYYIMLLVIKMIYRYKELMKNQMYKNDKKIKEALSKEKLFKIEYGLYSDKKNNSKLEIISKKYNNLIFNSDSAFFYHGLTDNIPLKYHLASGRKSRKINDSNIVQSFIEEKYFNIGDSFIYYNNVKIRIYDKERMLIELVRNKNKISYDMYKEIINNYRDIIDSLNMLKLQKYLKYFNDGEKYLKIIQEEVL